MTKSINRSFYGLIFFSALSIYCLANAESPYVQHQDREIKALSDQQIKQLQQGAGMGFALAAELNGYPGPKHVLELKSELELSAEQEQATIQLFDEMNQEARRVGIELIEAEQQLDSLFRDDKATEENVSTAVESISSIRSKLRSTHLIAHLQQIDILTSAQNARYQKLRGYNGSHEHLHHTHHSELMHQDH